MTSLRLRRLRLARSWGESTLPMIRRGLPIVARLTARVAASWAIRAMEGTLHPTQAEIDADDAYNVGFHNEGGRGR